MTFEVNLEGWTENAGPTEPMPRLQPGAVDLFGASYGMYGPNAGMPRLLGVLKRAKVAATVMVSGIVAERYPGLVRSVAAAGHEVAGHGYAQNLLACYASEVEEREQIDATIRAIREATGSTPLGWRSPRSTPSPRTEGLLAGHGIIWHGNNDSTDLPIVREVSGRKLVSMQRPVWINDLHLCIRPGNPARTLVTAFEDALEYALHTEDALPQFISVALHAHYLGRPNGAWALERMLAHAKGFSDVWIARVVDVAQLVMEGGLDRARSAEG